jgi:hypothetical protein
VLEDHHRVVAAQGRQQHAARILQRGRRQHAQARHVRVPGFEAVRVLRRELPAGAGGHADHDRHAHLAARHVAQRGGVVHDLVQRQQAEVDRHHLDDGAHAAQRRADARAHEGRLGKRRVAHPVFAELFQQFADTQGAAGGPSSPRNTRSSPSAAPAHGLR